MSFYRLIFYHALLGGWSAFVGWFLSELFILRRGDPGWFGLFFTAALVGAAIGGGLALLGALATGHFKGNELRFGFSLAGGFLGGALGGLVGNTIFQISANVVLRAIGWMFMGLGIGGVEGLYDRSFKKIRNGLIGGAVGGVLGGLFFPAVSSIGNMSGRAIGFVILGMCIGLFIGLAQIILREAWLTVEQGFRPGRQFVLNIPVTVLGTSEKAQLPFIAFGAKGVEPIHLMIEQQSNGTFVLRDNGSRTGTFVNGQRVQEVVLHNDDLIQLGPNTVRFREMVKHVTGENDGKDRRSSPVASTAALPEAKLIVAAPPPPSAPRVPAPTGVTAAAPKPRPAQPAVSAAPPRPKPTASVPQPRQQPAQPVAVQPKADTAQPPRAAPRGKACPVCQRPGTPIPGSDRYLCMSCDVRF